VRAFDGDRVAAEPAVEPAHGAPVGVSAHNLLGEARRAWPAHRGPRELGYLEDGEIKIDCRANHLAQHGREVLVQEQPRDRGQGRAISKKGGDFGPKLANGAVIKQPSRSFGRVRAYVIATAIAKLA